MKNNKLPERPCTIPTILEVLKNVVDPEVGINIVDLGLIFGVWIGREELFVEFTATSPGCPAVEEIGSMIVDELKMAFNREKISANVVWHTPWDQSFMAEDARIALGY